MCSMIAAVAGVSLPGGDGEATAALAFMGRPSRTRDVPARFPASGPGRFPALRSPPAAGRRAGAGVGRPYSPPERARSHSNAGRQAMLGQAAKAVIGSAFRPVKGPGTARKCERLRMKPEQHLDSRRFS